MYFTSDEKPAQATASPMVERDASFYFDDDPMAIFRVEDRLFKVHRHFLIQGSQIFRDMFSAGDGNEGRTDEKPILLPGVTKNEFEVLLRFFYPFSPRIFFGLLGPTTFPSTIQLTQDEKISLLSISHRFLFDDIFNLIKSQVPATSLSIVTRIHLGDKYDMIEWLSSAYVALLDRNPDDLSAEEAEALGFERLTCLYKAKCFMYQERVLEKADESATSNRDSGFTGSRAAGLGAPPPRASKMYGSFTAKSEKRLTPTSDVVKRFFKLK